jgi:translation initiation factor 2 gamma subunit (eIF-2gamma)
MVGHIIGHPGEMPQVFIEIDVQTTFLKRIVGSKEESGKATKIDSIKEGETLLINIGSTSCGGTVMSVRDVSIDSLTYSEHGPNPTHEACLCQHGRQDRLES